MMCVRAARRVLRLVMLKVVTSLVALLAFVWLSSTILGAISGGRIDAAQHATQATSVDDDDGGDEDVQSSMPAPPAADDDDDRDDADADADGGDMLAASAGGSRIHSPGAGEPRSMSRWGLRPSGEHRASADRPPRA